MRGNGQHHLVVLVLTLLIVVIVGAYWAMEPERAVRAGKRQLEHSLERGLELYARNCASCHGPQGEGCVGPPLNRKEFRGDPEENRQTAEYLTRVISDGRPGLSIPRWVRLPDGRWASYTAMPAWFRAKGGPLNEMHIEDLVRFIMLGDFRRVMTKVMEMDRELRESIKRAGQDPDEVLKLADAKGLTPQENERAKSLFESKGCVTCHRAGGKGGSVGADLSYVGSWGLTADFLREWIRDPAGTSKKGIRMPVFFSNYGPEVDTDPRRAVEYGDTVMPAIAMTEEELDLLVRYLMGLRAPGR